MNDLNALVETAVKSAPHNAPKPSATNEAAISKSERVRRYLIQHPESRNKDVVQALAKFGVTVADVGNAKNQLKKKASKSAQGKRTATVVKSNADKASTAKIPSEPKPVILDASIGLDVLEAGIEFINKAGGLNEAQYALNVIRRIKSI